MTHRERLLAALNHRQPDRVPLDLGSTLATTLTYEAHERLRTYLGLPADKEPLFFARRSGTVIPDEAILRRFDVDARPLLLGRPEYRPDRWLSDDALVDEWEVTWSRPPGGGGHFINSDGPFYSLANPSSPDLERHDWPSAADPGRYRGLRERAKAQWENTDFAVVLNLPLGPIHNCQFMRGFGEWLCDLLVNTAFAEALMDRYMDIWVEIATRALEEAGEYVDVVMVGDDIGTQNSALMSPEVYRKLIKPRHTRMVQTIKRFGKFVKFHCCGAIYNYIPDLIETGIDALNPIQVSAAHMGDTKRMKQEFGHHLTFWGAIDNLRVLSSGTPDDVRSEVRRRIDDLAGGGGYILSCVHNIQAGFPPENIVTMYDCALQYGG
jgi:uroporphyrinogen decarboxylase